MSLQPPSLLFIGWWTPRTPPTQAWSSRSQSSLPTLCTCTGGGLQWTSNQPVAETSTWQHPRWRKTCPLVGFEPTISAGERSQTYTSESAVTGTGIKIWISIYIYVIIYYIIELVNLIININLILCIINIILIILLN